MSDETEFPLSDLPDDQVASDAAPAPKAKKPNGGPKPKPKPPAPDDGPELPPEPKAPKGKKPAPTTAKADKAEPKADKDGPHLFALKGGKVEDLKIADIVRLKDAQSRDGLGEDAVDKVRVADYEEKMRAKLKAAKDGGEPFKWDPVSVMLVDDAPGEFRGVPTHFLWDGFHTLAAAEAAGVKTFRAKVYKGTIDDLRAAAASANRQHDDNGKPRTNADKAKAVRMLAKAYTMSSVPKDAWPSNRVFADMIGVSRNLVNEIDPFGRGAGDKHELKKAKKRKPTPSLAVPDHANAAAFDWTVYDTNLGYLVRGLDAMADTYGFKDSPEHRGAERLLNEFTSFFAGVKKKFGGKKK